VYATEPLISIVVDCFNYGRYVGAAIESALAQSYSRAEVIVVDDGSTDESRSIISRYEPDVVTVFKENGGQASAFNAGFRVAHGDIVIFLDADDTLMADTAARVVARFAADPSLVKVHYRLEIVDAEGGPTGAFTPAVSVTLPEGDLRARILSAPDDVPHPPSSGNAYAAAALRRVLPLTPHRRTGADRHLLNLVPLLGPVAALDGIGGRYRAHGANAFHNEAMQLESVRDTLRSNLRTHAEIERLASELGLVGPPVEVSPRSVTDLAQRLISLRLEPDLHPVPGDLPGVLARTGGLASLRRRDLPLRHRLLYVGWFAAMCAAPRSIARHLAEVLLSSWATGGVTLRAIHP
jgi:hypothetical protein